MEKRIISLLKGGSAFIYVVILCLVLSLPVLFIYQAFLPPVFTFDTVAIEESFAGDEIITENADEWQKLQLTLEATAGSLSPYSFYIEEFDFAKDVPKTGISEYKIVLDEPIFCTKDITDPFTLTVYVKADTQINEITENLSFTASDYTKSFGEFKLKFEDGKAQFFKK